eukprot:CAMPEP_0202815072 /NCGR_PEP_ID=MMETSP1389-20130828/6005_1 /ASSEMBLY_ACC=CAM_ASM_000865 /TAXON_ID=302021 /ORGANISM="Rhodomonas sp., Strain CCMP768" /LENGTH=161 /DNA_ID=CAMNT_0049486945 /DNA_START=270 /DNA_END=752 /DNA_ORIENTATION=-
MTSSPITIITIHRRNQASARTTHAMRGRVPGQSRRDAEKEKRAREHRTQTEQQPQKHAATAAAVAALILFSLSPTPRGQLAHAAAAGAVRIRIGIETRAGPPAWVLQLSNRRLRCQSGHRFPPPSSDAPSAARAGSSSSSRARACTAGGELRRKHLPARVA